MKKILLIILLLIIIINSKAQTKETLIEPQWSINLYFEDATGATDMLTFGYDPSADPYLGVIDAQFNEGWVQIDTTQFNVYLDRDTGVGPTPYPIDTDIVRKTEITSWPNPSMEFGWVHGQLPITMTWDEPKLNSPDLPNHFIDETPCTRARIDMWYNAGFVDEPACINTVIDPYQPPTSILSGSSCLVDVFCTFQNNITWNIGQISNEIVDNMGTVDVIVVPINDIYWAPTISVEDFEISTKIFPNPVTNYLYIEKQTDRPSKLIIYNMLGKTVLKNTFTGTKNRIDVGNFKKGIYFLKINNQIIKFIKNE